MKKIITELMATVLVVALLSFSGCGGGKDDPNIAEKEAKEGIEILDQAFEDVSKGRVSDEVVSKFKGW